MSQPINTIDTSDPRVQEIADYVGETPDEILASAEEYAAENEETVDQVLDTGAENVEIAEMLDGLGEDDEDDNDL